jgi:hypothetical protein
MVQAAGGRSLHLHDLRHTGNRFTANAGANPRELAARMGHDSERAALIYLHSSRERQRALADAVGKAARAELAKSKGPRRLPQRARGGHETAVRLLGVMFDLRPDRDSNAGPAV